VQESYSRTLLRDITYRAGALFVSLPMAGIENGLALELSKVLIYYVMERLWLRVSWGLNDTSEKHIRTLARAITYRIVATFSVAYWVGLELALSLAIIHTIIYYTNERLWLKVQWGRL